MTPRDFNEKILAGWGGADVFNQAVAIAAHGQVVSAEWDDAARKATGKISQSSGWDMPTGFTLSPEGHVKSHCPCRTNQQLGMICPHVVIP